MNLQEKGRMSLKDGKKGDGDEREDSGREWWAGAGGRPRVYKVVVVRAGSLSVKESEGGEGCTAGGSLFLCLLRL